MAAPVVSVVVTTYFRNDWVRMAVESLEEQTHDATEIIVIDDSGERHAAFLSDEFPDIHYVPQTTNLGPVAGRNLGVEEATGQYIHFLDDDDRLRPDAIARKVEFLESNPEYEAVYSGLYRERDDVEFLASPEHSGDILGLALRMQQPPCFPSTLLMTSDIANEIHPLPVEFQPAGDVALIVELARRSPIGLINEPLTIRGAASESLADTMDAARARRRIMEAYQELYDQYDPAVRQTAMAGVYKTEAVAALNESPWSATAINRFFLAYRVSPEFRFDLLGAFVLSIFGRRVWRTGQKQLAKLREK